MKESITENCSYSTSSLDNNTTFYSQGDVGERHAVVPDPDIGAGVAAGQVQRHLGRVIHANLNSNKSVKPEFRI